MPALRAFMGYIAITGSLTLASSLAASPWSGTIEVIPGTGGGQTIHGVVFEDLNADSRRQANEPGLAGVMVTNGLDVVQTDARRAP